MSANRHSTELSGRGDQQPRAVESEARSSDRRQSLGRLGEQLAVDHLVRRGCQILERNFRTRWGELDIVALDGETLAFCEVKARLAGGAGITPFDSLHDRKRRQVRRIARAWLATGDRRSFAKLVRFDAIGVIVDHAGQLVSLEHLVDAF